MEQGKRAVVALGMFDGMHKGHTQLVDRAVAMARECHAAPVVFTFANHPLEVLGKKPRLLSTLEERAARMYALGVSEVAAASFTREFADVTPDEFLSYLLSRYDVAAIVCGFNYTFGRRGAGTPEMLTAAGRARGFAVEVLPPVLEGGAPISSSRIREAIECGEIALANRMLGRTYRLTGTVVSNLQNGRRLGFPTANIVPDPALVLPKSGVYHTRAAIPCGLYPAVTNVGANPTLRAKKETVETHLIDFDGDLYGQTLSVSFIGRLRGEIAFSSLEALRDRIQKDVDTVREADSR